MWWTGPESAAAQPWQTTKSDGLRYWRQDKSSCAATNCADCRHAVRTQVIRIRVILSVMPGYEDELAQIVAQLNRAAPASRPARQETAQTTSSLDQLVAYATRRGASDVLLIAGAPVILR